MHRSTALFAVVFALILPLVTACQNDHQVEAITEAINLQAEGSDANSRGDWDHAIEVFTRIIELSPEVAGAYAYNERAFAYGQIGEIELAIDDHTKAIQIEPDNPIGYNQRALYYDELGRWEEAVADLDLAIELRPERVDQYNGRALANLNLANYQAVVDDLTLALQLDPSGPLTPIYLSNRAEAFVNLGEFDLGMADYEHSLALDPANWTTHLKRAASKTEAGLLDEAMSDLESALGETVDPQVMLGFRMTVLGLAGQFEQAITVIDQLLALDPESALLWAGRGQMWAELGETDRARADFEAAIALTDDPALIAKIEGELQSLGEAAGAIPSG